MIFFVSSDSSLPSSRLVTRRSGHGPIRGQFQGHVITLDQLAANIQAGNKESLAPTVFVSSDVWIPEPEDGGE